MAFKQSHVALFLQDMTVTNGAPFFLDLFEPTMYGGTLYQEPTADGDEFEFTISLDPGDYLMTLLGVKGSVSAIQEIYFNDVLVASVDRYMAALTDNTVDLFDVTINTKKTVVRSLVNGKRAASGAYYVSITHWAFMRK